MSVTISSADLIRSVF